MATDLNGVRLALILQGLTEVIKTLNIAHTNALKRFIARIHILIKLKNYGMGVIKDLMIILWR